MNNKEKIQDLRIGLVIQKDKNKSTDDNEEVFIDDESRKSNLLVISTKNSGKSNTLIPYMFLQDMQNKDAGTTFFIGRSTMAFLLYTIAKEYNRKVRLIKPTIDAKVLNKLIYSNLSAKEISEFIANEVLDYSKAIRDKEIIIIDMEYDKYSTLAYKANVALLLQLQQEMLKETITLKRRHYVYIDDAYRYVDYLSNLLQYGDDYNISTTLFFGSRSQFKTKYRDYSSLIDTNVRNTLLLQGITYEDAVYYAKRIDLPEVDNPDRYFNEAQVKDLLNRKYGEFTYEILGKGDFVRKIGVGQLNQIKEEELNKLKEKAKRKANEFKKGLDNNEQSYSMFEENRDFENLLKNINSKNKTQSFVDVAILRECEKHNKEDDKKEELNFNTLPSSSGNLSKDVIDNLKNKQTNKNKIEANKRKEERKKKAEEKQNSKIIEDNFKKREENNKKELDLNDIITKKISEDNPKQSSNETLEKDNNPDTFDMLEFDGEFNKDMTIGGFDSDEQTEINVSKPEDIGDSILESKNDNEVNIEIPKEEKNEKQEDISETKNENNGDDFLNWLGSM